jgi:Fur family transcriptional regulator, zinc uptake regulator
MDTPPMPAEAAAFPSTDHDHRSCLEALAARVERLCSERRLRMTAQRRRVLEIVAASHAAVGAYEILGRLAEVDRRPPAPISVYRALDFLIRNELVHRVESLNAYVACAHVGERHRAQFLVCRTCRRVAELESPSIEDAIAAGAAAASFAVTAPVVEIGGICRACRPEAE